MRVRLRFTRGRLNLLHSASLVGVHILVPMNAADPKSIASFTAASTEAGVKWEGHMADDVAATFGPDPLALLIATTDSLYLSSTRGNFRLPRNAVVGLGRGKFYPWFFSAVRIHHTIPGYPKALQFKPLRVPPREVLKQLHLLGYPEA